MGILTHTGKPGAFLASHQIHSLNLPRQKQKNRNQNLLLVFYGENLPIKLASLRTHDHLVANMLAQQRARHR